jgi:hypothetical protein
MISDNQRIVGGNPLAVENAGLQSVPTQGVWTTLQVPAMHVAV